MAANSLLEMSRSLRLYVPQLPITLAEQFIRDRYRRILERRDWSALRREGEFILNAERTDGTISISRGSTIVAGTGTSFIPTPAVLPDVTDEGRQFKTGSDSPIYTIVSVDSSTQLTLDRPYGGATVTDGTYRVFDGYLTAPEDFLRFLTVTDPNNGFRLPFWITKEELDAMDPQRTSFGEPYMIVDRMFNIANTRPQFEAWPFTTSARTLYYTYIKRGADLTDEDDTPIWPLTSDVIVQGALADVAKWPGTAEKPNPYFARPEYWKAYEGQYNDLLIELERRDEEVYMTMLKQAALPLHPMSARWIQSHAV